MPPVPVEQKLPAARQANAPRLPSPGVAGIQPRDRIGHVPTFAKFGLVALVALVFTVLPGGGQALDVALALLSIVFFTAIALIGYRLHRQFGSELLSLTDRQRAVLYGSIGLAFLTFCATDRLFDTGGAGVITWLALLSLASYGVYWVWGRYRAYE
jgi:hypothetical protein